MTARITHDGRTQSIAAWAVEAGVSQKAMLQRIARCKRGGRPIAEALARDYRQRRGRGETLTHAGRTQTIRQWADEIGISPTALRARLGRHGVDAALSMPAGPRAGTSIEAHHRARLLTHDGRTQTLSAWARETGIPPIALGYRLRSGWPVERALSEPVHRRRREHAIGTIVLDAATRWAGHRQGPMQLHQHISLALALLALLVEWPEGYVPAEIGLRLGVSPKVATAMLKALRDAGVPVAPETAVRGAAWRIGAETRTIDWDAQPLGEIADGKLAAQIGCSRTLVVRERVARGIPAAHPKHDPRRDRRTAG